MSLPAWPGASEAYRRAYRRLEKMARTHVQIVKNGRKQQCIVSEEMREVIDALNRGDEEFIKHFNLSRLVLEGEL